MRKSSIFWGLVVVTGLLLFLGAVAGAVAIAVAVESLGVAA